MMKRKITGSTLIEMGYTPGKYFGEALEYLNSQGNLTEVQIREYVDSIMPQPVETIEPFESAVSYKVNIHAETEEEKANLEDVINTMEILMKTPTVVNGAIMPDACPTGTPGHIPVGGVVVAKNAIHPGWHSADICCSVMATLCLGSSPKDILDIAESITHFGPGGRFDDKFKLPENLLEKIKSNRFLNDSKSIELAHTHLGTQGDGNHFLYVGVEKETGATTLVTHHGSRGFGAYLYKKGMKVAEEYRRKYSPNTLKCNAWIPFDSEDGQDYWEALQIVREWTKLNHHLIHEEVGANMLLSLWNEHNFVFKRDDLFYHAKGATPLLNEFVPDSFDGSRIIPLNMSEPILIVGGEENENNLGFAPHGAGRNYSRKEHERKHEGRYPADVFHEETRHIDARFFSGKIDISELPSAYKNAQKVREQIVGFGLGEVVTTIEPYGCIMAGDWKKY